MMKELIEKTIATEQVFNGRMIDLQIDTVSLPNGATATREIIRHPGAVAILAITADKKNDICRTVPQTNRSRDL